MELPCAGGARPRHNQAVDAETAYVFRHALMRDAAYALQPPEERAALHAGALSAFEALFDDTAREPMCAELADHAAQARAQDAMKHAHLGQSEAAYRLRAALVDTAAYRNEGALAGFQAVADHPDATHQQRITALLEITEIMAFMPNALQAVPLAERAAELARQAGELPIWLKARKRVTWLRSDNGQLAEAMSEQAKLVEIARGLPDRSVLAGLLSDFATMQRSAGRYAEAENSMIEALALARQLGQSRGIATVEVNLGAMYLHQDRAADAVELFQSAVKRLTGTPHKRVLRIAMGNLASALRRTRPDDAETWYLRALELARETGDQESLASAVGGLGELRSAQHRHEEAEQLYLQAIALRAEAGSAVGAAIAMGNLGSLLENQGRLEEAQQWYGRALEGSTVLGDVHAMAYWRVSLAMVAARQGKWPEMAEHCSAARAEAEGSGDGVLAAVYHGLLAVLLRAQGNVAEAEARWAANAAGMARLQSLAPDTHHGLRALWQGQRDN